MQGSVAGRSASEALRILTKLFSEQLQKAEEECYFLALDLLCHYVGLSRSLWALYAYERIISSSEATLIQQASERLLAFEPLQYILEEAPFGSFSLSVGAGVLIPRPETEELCDLIVRDFQALGRSVINFLELGAGSGAIALMLAKHLRSSKGFALEKSPQAFSYLQKNISRYKDDIAPSEVNPIAGDLLLPENFLEVLPPLDLVVSNPPYIAEEERATLENHVLFYEPHEALFAPPEDPLFFYRAIATLCHQLPFSPDARLFLEVNSRFAQETAHIFCKDPLFSSSEVMRDISGRPRFIACTLQPKSL